MRRGSRLRLLFPFYCYVETEEISSLTEAPASGVRECSSSAHTELEDFLNTCTDWTCLNLLPNHYLRATVMLVSTSEGKLPVYAQTTALSWSAALSSSSQESRWSGSSHCFMAHIFAFKRLWSHPQHGYFSKQEGEGRGLEGLMERTWRRVNGEGSGYDQVGSPRMPALCFCELKALVFVMVINSSLWQRMM